MALTMFTPELIKEINQECPYEQGIFVQGWGVPTHVKEACIYSRYETGGVRGGSCWGGTTYGYSQDIPKNVHEILDIILKKLCPSITYLQYKEIEALWEDNSDAEVEYYGNSTNYHIDYMPLSKLEEMINSFI